MKLEHLNDEQIRIGVLKAIENSQSLIEDGTILFNSCRYPRAFALFQFSNEELGKALLLFHILILRKTGYKIDYEKFDKQICNHQPKHRYSVGIEFAALSMIYTGEDKHQKEQLLEIIEKLGAAKTYNAVKNSSLYIDFIGDSFKTPFEQISKEIVETIKTDAENRYTLYSYKIDERLGNIEKIADSLKEFEKNPPVSSNFLEDLNGIFGMNNGVC